MAALISRLMGGSMGLGNGASCTADMGWLVQGMGVWAEGQPGSGQGCECKHAAQQCGVDAWGGKHMHVLTGAWDVRSR